MKVLRADKKTLRLWIWYMIQQIAGLGDDVVSFAIVSLILIMFLTILYFSIQTDCLAGSLSRQYTMAVQNYG